MRFLNARGAIAIAFMIAASVQPSAAETIKIGVFGPFSGDAAAMGGSEKDAVSLVIQEKNAAGGIRGQQIEPVYADDSGKPEEAVNTIKRLISRDDVLLNIGSISSPASLAASQVSRQSETAQIVVGGTAQRITTSGNKWVFRSPVPDTKLVADLVDFIHEKFPKVTKFAFLYVNDDFGRGGFEAFKAAGAKYGFEIVDEERYTRGDIYFTAHFSVATTTDIPVAKDFVAKFRKAYGRDPDSYAAEAYDAATMAVLAVEAADKPDRASVRDALAKVSFESSRGSFKFDDKGDPLLVTHVVKIVDGKETNARNMPVQN